MQKIPQDEYKKAKWQFSRQVQYDVLCVFDLYGMGTLIPGAVEEIMELTEQFAMRARGKDIPIKLSRKRNHR